ncbi:MAG: CHAD domain-containing protein [Methylococcales bacterium]|nr:CHAD domain-containing protein [Methylococcales bacterium]
MSSIGLLPSQSLAEAGQKVLKHHFHEFLKQESDVRLSKDIEAVHDMRVATRRMRATLRIFKKGFTPSELKFLTKGLQQTAHVLGAVRDLDVFIEKLTIYQHKFPLAEQIGLAPLLEYCHRQRDEARAKMLAYLQSNAYKKFKTQTAHFLNKDIQTDDSFSIKPFPNQIQHVAPVLIYERYEALRAYEPFLMDASVELLHQLRIDFKYFRYTLENFHDILGNESGVVLANVKEIQNHLGDLNDTNVACQFLKNFLHNWKHYRKSLATTRSKKPSAIIDYLNVKLAEKERLLSTFPSVWHQFNSTNLRLNLALSISIL